MITITQEKPQIHPIIVKNNLENVPALSTSNTVNYQALKMNTSIDQNNSKITRKHKIFGNR